MFLHRRIRTTVTIPRQLIPGLVTCGIVIVGPVAVEIIGVFIVLFVRQDIK